MKTRIFTYEEIAVTEKNILMFKTKQMISFLSLTGLLEKQYFSYGLPV